MPQSKTLPRRRHGADFKAQVLAACAEPGASVAAVAQAYALNANLVHKWRRGRGTAEVVLPAAHAGHRPTAGASQREFIALALPGASTPGAPADIRVELRRGAAVMTVSWPTSAARDCAAWLQQCVRGALR